MEQRITIDPAVCHGKPCIRGLRYPLESVLEWLAAGMRIDDILADYADLERDDILAVLADAPRLARVNRIEPRQMPLAGTDPAEDPTRGSA